MIHTLKSTALALVTAGLFAPQASAEDIKWGGQVTVSIPGGKTGDAQHLDGKPGFGLGVHAFIHLKEGHALVPRFDYILYSNSSPDPNHWAPGVELKNRLMLLGADYQYHFAGKPGQGFYALAGLAYGDMQYKLEGHGGSLDYSSSKPVLAVGGGYQFNPKVGLELRYLNASFEPNGVSMSAPSLNATLMVRF